MQRFITTCLFNICNIISKFWDNKLIRKHKLKLGIVVLGLQVQNAKGQINMGATCYKISKPSYHKMGYDIMVYDKLSTQFDNSVGFKLGDLTPWKEFGLMGLYSLNSQGYSTGIFGRFYTADFVTMKHYFEVTPYYTFNQTKPLTVQLSTGFVIFHLNTICADISYDYSFTSISSHPHSFSFGLHYILPPTQHKMKRISKIHERESMRRGKRYDKKREKRIEEGNI